MVCLSRLHPFKFCKGCLPQILLCLFLNTSIHLIKCLSFAFHWIRRKSFINKNYFYFLPYETLHKEEQWGLPRTETGRTLWAIVILNSDWETITTPTFTIWINCFFSLWTCICHKKALPIYLLSTLKHNPSK